jgi:methionyl-tRNA formyltransferase
MRTALIGAVESSRVALAALIDAGAPPAVVVTLGRDHAARHSDYVDLAPLARDANIPVLSAPKINDPGIVDALEELKLDYMFVIGWSQICAPALLATAPRGAVGYHPAPLPAMRGRAVIPWTILRGVRQSASTLFWIDDGVDSGDVLAQRFFDVAEDETAATLYAKHMIALRGMMPDVIGQLSSGQPNRAPQDHSRATYCARRTAEDGIIDWSKPAREIWTLIRAVGAPYPGAFTFLKGTKLTVLDASYIGAAPYFGLPGQVQALMEEGALVQCGDGEHVLLRHIILGAAAEPVRAASAVKQHARFGIDPAAMHELGRKGAT